MPGAASCRRARTLGGWRDHHETAGAGVTVMRHGSAPLFAIMEAADAPGLVSAGGSEAERSTESGAGGGGACLARGLKQLPVGGQPAHLGRVGGGADGEHGGLAGHGGGGRGGVAGGGVAGGGGGVAGGSEVRRGGGGL